MLKKCPRPKTLSNGDDVSSFKNNLPVENALKHEDQVMGVAFFSLLVYQF